MADINLIIDSLHTIATATYHKVHEGPPSSRKTGHEVAFDQLKGTAAQLEAIFRSNPAPSRDSQENIAAQFGAMQDRFGGQFRLAGRIDDERKAPGVGSLHVMTLDSGQVGIGTGTVVPTAKLQVNGRIKDQTGYVMPVGSILAYHGAKAPDGWLLCDGGSIPKDAKYQDLRTLLQKDTTPDLRGRTLIGAGLGAGLSLRALAQQGGEENHKLTILEMPSHNHHGFGEAYDNWPFGQVGKNQKGSRGGIDEDNYYYNTSNTGGNTPFTNMQPYHVVNYIIKY